MKTYNPTIHGFKFATGDINYLDYGATWVRQAGTRTYHFIRLINWEDSVGEREAKEIGERYNMQLSVVDLNEISAEQLRSALDSCGDDRAPDAFPEETQACFAFEYGSYVPVVDVNTSNFRETFRQLARESRRLSTDKRHRRKVMSRKVNRIGSTAKEFMRGDIKSALIRGVIAEDPRALLVAKLYAGAAGAATTKTEEEK